MPTVATEVVLLVHIPPAVASVNDEVNVLQIPVVPEIGAGCVFTVTTVV